jgi:uncharacterized membrane protein
VAIGFLADASNDGHVAVFIPGAPDPSSGVVQILSSDNVTPIDISHGDVIACLEQSGRGLPNLLGKSFLRRLCSETTTSTNERETDSTDNG